jgi:hypothetical protein
MVITEKKRVENMVIRFQKELWLTHLNQSLMPHLPHLEPMEYFELSY